jgi:outer membrane protein TolC
MSAQESHPLSLHDAIELALKSRSEIKIQQLNAAVSENEIRKVGARHLPQVTSDLDVRYNSQLQTNVLPGEAFGQPGTPDRRVQLGAKYSTVWGLNLTLPLYNPSDVGDKKVAETQYQYDQLNERRSAIDVRQQVTESYFVSLLWQEKLNLSQSNLTRTQALYDMAQGQLRQGSILAYDVQRSRIDLENAIAENTRNANSYRLALSDLFYKMGVDPIAGVAFKDDLTSLLSSYREEANDDVTPDRVELQQEKIKGTLHQMNIRKQRLLYLPTVSAYGSYSVQYLNNSFQPFTSSNWYPYNYVGVKASIPVFDGFQKKRTRAGYALQYQATQLNIGKLTNDYRQETRNASTAMYNAQADFENQKRNLDLANELFDIDSGRFKHGAIRQNDLTTTYYMLQQTQTNYLNAIYTYLVAVVQYKKATGVL